METYNIKHTLKEFCTLGRPSNYVCLFLSVLISFFIGLREIDLLNLAYEEKIDLYPIYVEYSSAFWATAWALFAYSLTLPLIRVKTKPFGNRVSIIGFAVLGALFVTLLIFIVTHWQGTEASNQDDMISIVGLILASIVAIFGWFVQYQVSRHNNRINHSLNVLLQTRLSEEFQRHSRASSKTYPNRKFSVIPPEDVDYYFNGDVEANSCQTQQQKVEAISAQIYIINHYEFLSCGIESNVLDEELLYKTLAGIILRQIERSEHIIKHSKSISPKTFEHLLKIKARWAARHHFESHGNKKGAN